jgi:hypothetical protein
MHLPALVGLVAVLLVVLVVALLNVLPVVLLEEPPGDKD